MEKRRKFPVGRAVLYTILLFWAVFMIMPFAWMLLTSLKAQRGKCQQGKDLVSLQHEP